MIKKILLSVIIFLGISLSAQDYKKVKIHLTNPKEDARLLCSLQYDLEHCISTKQNELILFVSDKEFQKLQTLPYKVDVLINSWNDYFKNLPQLSAQDKQLRKAESKAKYGVEYFGYGSMGGYYTFDEVTAQLDSMRMNFPNLISVKETIGTSVEGRPIYAVKIAKNPDADGTAPQILYTALHHAREPEGMMTVLYYMYYLLENYATNPSVKYLVDNREMWFVPVVNPDGYEYNRSSNAAGGGMWRKNRVNSGNGNYGVDLNRNYGPLTYWDAANGGSSALPADETYRGKEPFSEPETQAIRDFVALMIFRTALNYHTYSNLLIYPYGALPHETPDSVLFREFGSDMVAYNGYFLGLDMDAVGYSTRGNSDDFMYDGDTSSRGKILSMTPEVGGETDGFWPEQDRIIPIAQENLMPNLYYAWVTGDYIAINKVSFNKPYFSPGDSIVMSVQLKNKGLATGRNISLQLTTLSNSASFANALVNIDSIPARTLNPSPNLFAIKISAAALQTETIRFVLATKTNSIVMATDTISITLGKPVYAFYDSANSISKYWTVSANPATNKWDTTNATFASPNSCYTDSKSGAYAANATVAMTMTNPVSLAGLANPHLSFKTKFDIESQWDCGVLLISTDNGSSWTALAGQYTKAASGLAGSKQTTPGMPIYDGQKTNWVTEDINLSAYTGKSIKLRFELRTDAATEKDGWYLDDIGIYTYAAFTDAGTQPRMKATKFALEQNYPNPFNPYTTIHYTVATEGKVSLRVYDILGKEVVDLVNEVKQSGSHEATFNATELPSGVYFYELRAGSFSEMKKMMLIK